MVQRSKMVVSNPIEENCSEEDFLIDRSRRHLRCGGTAAFAAELPTYELTGFPISPVQLRLLGAANVQERSPTPVTASLHQVSVLTSRPGLTTGTTAVNRRPKIVRRNTTFAADMLFNGAAEQSFPRKMPADAWFDFRGCDRFEVEEQSFLLPNEEVLTVLKLPDEAVS
jgi:hypothetical protein